VGSYLTGVRWLGLPPSGVKAALGKMLEGMGMTLAFLLANLAVGVGAVLTGSLLAGRFVSPYLIADQLEALLALSLLQALVFQGWRETPARPR